MVWLVLSQILPYLKDYINIVIVVNLNLFVSKENMTLIEELITDVLEPKENEWGLQ